MWRARGTPAFVEAARRHGVVGTVSNRPDGTVFIDVQAPVDAP